MLLLEAIKNCAAVTGIGIVLIAYLIRTFCSIEKKQLSNYLLLLGYSVLFAVYMLYFPESFQAIFPAEASVSA